MYFGRMKWVFLGVSVVGAMCAHAEAEKDIYRIIEERNLLQEMENAEIQVEKLLEEFKASSDSDPELLVKARELVSSIYGTRSTTYTMRDDGTRGKSTVLVSNSRHKDWGRIWERLLRLRIEIIQEAFRARDWEYDLQNPPLFSISVCPPFGYGQFVISGMRPEDVKDPEARRIYKEAIRENEQKAKKHRRERTLQRFMDYAIQMLEMVPVL